MRLVMAKGIKIMKLKPAFYSMRLIRKAVRSDVMG